MKQPFYLAQVINNAEIPVQVGYTDEASQTASFFYEWVCMFLISFCQGLQCLRIITFTGKVYVHILPKWLKVFVWKSNVVQVSTGLSHDNNCSVATQS